MHNGWQSAQLDLWAHKESKKVFTQVLLLKCPKQALLPRPGA